MGHTFDKVAILLSTDWFFDYWLWIGLTVESGRRLQLQKQCRTVVRDMQGAADTYWQIDFSEKRVSRTKRLLQKALTDAVGDNTAVDYMNAQLKVAQRFDDNGDDSSSLLCSLTQLIASGQIVESLDPIAFPLRNKIIQVWKDFASEPDFGELCAMSNSTWDRYVRSLTPDLPMATADYVSVELVARRKFPLYWEQVKETLRTEELDVLANWYRSATLLLTGRPIELKGH